jgi:hypothetical protein
MKTLLQTSLLILKYILVTAGIVLWLIIPFSTPFIVAILAIAYILKDGKW